LPGDNQLVPHLPSHDRDDDFLAFHIIQDSKVACPQFILGHRIRAQPLDGTRECCWLMKKSRCDRRLQDSLLTNRQCQKLMLGLFTDRDMEGHGLWRFVPSITLSAQHSSLASR